MQETQEVPPLRTAGVFMVLASRPSMLAEPYERGLSGCLSGLENRSETATNVNPAVGGAALLISATARAGGGKVAVRPELCRLRAER